MARTEDLAAALQDVRKMKRSIRLREETDPDVVAETLQRILKEAIAIRAANDGRLGKGAVNELKNIRNSLVSGQVNAGAAGSEYMGKISLVLDELETTQSSIESESATKLSGSSIIDTLKDNVPSASTLVSAMITANPILGYSTKILNDLFSSRKERNRSLEMERKKRLELLSEELDRAETEKEQVNEEIDDKSNEGKDTTELESTQKEFESIKDLKNEIRTLSGRSGSFSSPTERDITGVPGIDNERQSESSFIATDNSSMFEFMETQQSDDMRIISEMKSDIQKQLDSLSSSDNTTDRYKSDILNEEMGIVQKWENEEREKQTSFQRAPMTENMIKTENEENTTLERIYNETEDNAGTLENIESVLERQTNNQEKSYQEQRMDQRESEFTSNSLIDGEGTGQEGGGGGLAVLGAGGKKGGKGMLGGLFGLLGGLVAGIGVTLLKPFKALFSFLKTGGKMLSGFVRFAGRASLILAPLIAIYDFIEGMLNAKEILGLDNINLKDRLLVGLSNVITGLLQPIDWVLDFFNLGFMEERDDLTKSIFYGLDKVVDFIMQPIDWLIDITKQGVDFVSNFSLTDFIDKIQTSIDSFLFQVTDTIYGFIDDIRLNVSNIITDISDSFTDKIDNITEMFTNMSDKLRDISDGIVNWTENKIQWVQNKFDWLPFIESSEENEGRIITNKDVEIRFMTEREMRMLDSDTNQLTNEMLTRGFEERYGYELNTQERDYQLVETPDNVSNTLNETIQENESNSMRDEKVEANQNNVVAPVINNRSTNNYTMPGGSGSSNRDRTWRRASERYLMGSY